MGMTPVMWTRLPNTATFDTDGESGPLSPSTQCLIRPLTDFNINGGITSVGQVLLNWQRILGNVSSLTTGFIVLEHDLFQQAVDVATGYILPDALAHTPKFKITTVIDCLKKPPSDAYVETNDNSTSPPPKSGKA
jgi:hypothetical protein